MKAIQKISEEIDKKMAWNPRNIFLDQFTRSCSQSETKTRWGEVTHLDKYPCRGNQGRFVPKRVKGFSLNGG